MLVDLKTDQLFINHKYENIINMAIQVKTLIIYTSILWFYGTN